MKQIKRRVLIKTRLKIKSDECIESLKDAASHKKRENRQVCAGTFRFGVCFILALVRFAQAQSVFTTHVRHHFTAGIYHGAPEGPLIAIIGLTFRPRDEREVAAGIGSVREGEFVRVHVGRLIDVHDCDSKPYWRVPEVLTKGLEN